MGSAKGGSKTIYKIYNELAAKGVQFYLWDLDCKAVTLEMAGEYAVFLDFDRIAGASEEAVVLAHEAGHIFTGATHRVASPWDLIERHEQRADRWAIRRLLPYGALRQAMRQGCTEPYQLAERFGVTEPFVKKACGYYHDACGLDFND